MSETKKTESFSADERAAMKERAKELKASAGRAESLKDLQAKISEMDAADRAIAQTVHEIVTRVAPQLTPKTWYGSPAYSDADGKVVIFFQDSKKFKTRYSTLGFQEAAQLDDGSMWPTSYALTKLTAADEKLIAALVTKAAG